ncbi:iron ABC transporter permease [Mesorhizobium sp. WSM2239]|uniref:Iron ABC transporter permease n=2 Tax=unclassified Mesorhizobium TaxID=325217 RepID=A0AAU8DJ53_9HYPH
MSEAINAALSRHRAAERRKVTLVAGLLVLACVSLVFDIATGPALLPVPDVVAALISPATTDPTTQIIVWTLRLPMALMAIVVGVALGSSGATMQTLLDNPLASPYTLGLASAAGFGASLAILNGGWGLNPLFIAPACAFIVACLASALIYVVGNMRGMMGDTMILAGIALMFLFHSLQSLLQFHATPEVGQQIVFWMFGTLAKATWTNLLMTAAAVAVSMPLLMLNAWKLTALRLGEQRARAVGVSVSSLRLTTIALVSLMTATAISFVGTIGFIGLVAPHIARMLVGEDQRYLLVAAGCVGAVMLSLSSVLSKIIMPGVLLPVGIVTAVIGVPFFLHLILRRSREY